MICEQIPGSHSWRRSATRSRSPAVLLRRNHAGVVALRHGRAGVAALRHGRAGEVVFRHDVPECYYAALIVMTE